MNRSPCLKCDLLDHNKNNPECEGCQKRLDYLRELDGGASATVRQLDADTSARAPIKKTEVNEKRISMYIRKPYTPEENKFIIKHFETMPYKQIAKKIGRTEGSVSQKIMKMGLNKQKQAVEKTVEKPVAEIAVVEKPIEIAVAEIAETDEKKRKYFILDFLQNPDLFDDLKQIAKDDFRTPENQIMYLIKQEIERKSNKFIPDTWKPKDFRQGPRSDRGDHNV